MRKILRSGFQKIEILKWYESDTTDSFMEFRDAFSALNFLRKFMHDHFNMVLLRNTLAEALSYTSISRLTDHEILQQLAWQIVRGYIKLVPRVDEVPRVVLLGRSAEAAAEAAEMEVVEAPAPGVAPAAAAAEPAITVTNARWSQQEARRGDTLTLTADVSNAPDGTRAAIEIWEHDADGAHDFITRLSAPVNNNKVEAQWEFEYHKDTDDIPTAEESEKGYNPPEYFFRVKVRDVSAESGLLEFKDWIEIELTDPFGNPFAGEEYVVYLPDGQERRGKLDDQGFAREEDIPPGPCEIEFINSGR